jgi:hypothetical protein
MYTVQLRMPACTVGINMTHITQVMKSRARVTVLVSSLPSCVLILRAMIAQAGIAMDYRMDSWGSTADMGKFFSLLHSVWTTFGAHPAS